ncbi:hypothetical protein FGG08_000620 [Glutinoglossum americanum]|uniref:Kinesin light chain n=1 Tax=Glutinoglossum americanum TaxID=1670608 RepID=A0A9P8L3M5_9PEZI|nr:hypothetical protein FGG08_000620 [Glutinoglossum americanum]
MLLDQIYEKLSIPASRTALVGLGGVRDVALKLVEESNIIVVEPMDKDQALALFEKKLRKQMDKDGVAKLVMALEFMLLAIVQAAAYIKEWALSLMNFFDWQEIPEALIYNRSGLEYNPGANSVESKESNSDDNTSEGSIDDGFDDDVLTLRNYLFISFTTDASIFEMHALVQLASRKWLEGQGQLKELKKKYITNLCREFPTEKYENWAKCRVLFPHVKSALAQQPEGEESPKEWALLLYNVTWSMKVRKKQLGKEQGDTLSSMAMVRLVYNLEKKWKEAEELEVQVMETRKRVLGAEHPSTLISMANLALTYRNQGRWKEAKELEVQVMETSKRVLGAKHPSTLTSMTNLAFMFKFQDCNREAILLLEKCFKLQEKVLGPQHPYTTSSLRALNE